MEKKEDIRIDKWLWAVRIYKTRSIAIEEIKKGRVLIDGISPKPSRIVKVGEMLTIRKPPVIYSYKVLGLIHNRVSAQKAREFVENLTTDEEMMKLTFARTDLNFRREKGTGRPTKRDRREIDKLRE